MKIILFICLLSINLIVSAEDNSVKLIEKEYSQFLKLLKEGKVEDALSVSVLSEKEVDEIFNEKAPKEKIIEFITKLKEFQMANKDKIVNEIAPKLSGDAELKIEPKIIEKSAVQPWLKDNVSIYRLFVKYPNGTSGGTGTAIVFNNKFKFIRSFDSLPEGIKMLEEKTNK